ncbi:MAG: STAS domain-containing protein [Lachnospiraceae bacterium]|nr:STAS domain-containing protein [Lachnospiraceae bacterium]
MKITKTKEGSKLTIALEDSLNTNTAPELEAELQSLDDVKELIFDLKDLNYISSAGLRVMFAAHKTMIKHDGRMVLKNACEEVKEILEMTGFRQVFTVE